MDWAGQISIDLSTIRALKFDGFAYGWMCFR
jgi:hypothetical protein